LHGITTRVTNFNNGLFHFAQSLISIPSVSFCEEFSQLVIYISSLDSSTPTLFVVGVVVLGGGSAGHIAVFPGISPHRQVAWSFSVTCSVALFWHRSSNHANSVTLLYVHYITLLCVCYMYGAFIPFPYCTPPSCKICKLMICKLVDSYVSDAASTSVNKNFNKINKTLIT
jgi:hypothetical protein